SDQPLERQIDLADEHTIGEFVGDPPHLGDDVVHLRPIGRVQGNQAMVRQVGRAETRIRRIVAKPSVLCQMPDDDDAKAVDASLNPETLWLVGGGSYGGIARVEIRLGGEKGMIVILSGCAVIFPSTAAEY